MLVKNVMMAIMLTVTAATQIAWTNSAGIILCRLVLASSASLQEAIRLLRVEVFALRMKVAA
jgi:hypothetical protein